MIDRAAHENLDGQLDMWRDVIGPDRDGLFDAAGVAELCRRRRCSVSVQSDLVLTVTTKAAIKLVAMAPGRWDPVAILTACTQAQGRQAFEVDVESALVMNLGGLDEVKIARIVGASGLRPYLSRKGAYARRGPIAIGSPAETKAHPDLPWPRANAGAPTWALIEIFSIEIEAQCIRQPAIDKHPVRIALRALADVGLLSIKPGPRGGMSRASFTWTERAYLPPSLNLYEHDAINEIAAGLV